MSDAMIDVVIQRLDRQASLAEDLVGLARSQAACIASGDADQLLELLERRQCAIDELLTIQDELAPLTSEIESKATGSMDLRGEEAAALIETIQLRLEEIAAIDSADRSSLQRRLRELDESRQINDTARTARKVYGVSSTSASGNSSAASTQQPRFTDQKG